MLRRAILVALLAATACQMEQAAPEVEVPAAVTPARFGSGWTFVDGVATNVHFEIVADRALYEGDIDLGPVSRISGTLNELLSGPMAGVVTDIAGRRWAGGIVPYLIGSPALSSAMVADAIDEIETRAAGIQFVPKQSYHTNWIKIIVDTVTSARCGVSQGVGRLGGEQYIGVDTTCVKPYGILLHELGHALGFQHEHNRCDRNSYVDIDTTINGPIDSLHRDMFYRQCTNFSDHEDYDESSIMHYRKNHFGKVINGDTSQTIFSLRSLDHLMGQRDSLSQIDVNTLNRIYPGYPIPSASVTNQSGSPYLSWGAYGKGSSGYTVRLVIEYHECNDVEQWCNSYETANIEIGTPSGTSFHDTERAYETGSGLSNCYLYQESYGHAQYMYFYEISPTWPTGYIANMIRKDAPVAAGYYC